MKLDRINQLIVYSAHHHLIATKVRGCQQVEPIGNAIQLQSVILPDTQNTCFSRVILPETGFRIAQAKKDRIARLSDADEAVLILNRTVLSLFMLLQLVESHDARSKAQPNQLMPATNCQDRNSCLPDEASKVLDNLAIVVVKVTQGSTQHDGLGLELCGSHCQFRNVNHFGGRPLYQALEIADYVLDGHAGDLPLALQMGPGHLAPL